MNVGLIDQNRLENDVLTDDSGSIKVGRKDNRSCSRASVLVGNTEHPIHAFSCFEDAQKWILRSRTKRDFRELVAIRQQY